MKPTAKKLILGLLLASEGRPLSVQAAVRACKLFGITENNVRVSLARMSAEGLIESRGRGCYGLGPAARSMAGEVAHWHNAEQQVCDWSGAYICVHSAGLGRSNRKALLQRERALHMLGLRQLERGLHLRPDNLDGGLEMLHQRLCALGLESDAVVLRATEFDRARHASIEALWDVAAINQSYRQEHARLQNWMDRCAELEADDAARESYLMGGAAIRQVVFDPWLPEQWIDAEARHAFIRSVKQFDETGKAIWANLGSQDERMPLANTTSALRSQRLQ